MKKQLLKAICTLALAGPLSAAPKNAILFIGDGMGVSSLNAASIYGYGQPQALFMEKMPHMALADTSTAKEWVTDAAASASAWATGRKGRNGVVSQSTVAERDVKDGETLKTVLEFAEERGLSTGIIANDDRTGVTIAAVAAFYAHNNNRQRSAEIFQQLLHPAFGNGPDVVIGTGRKWISEKSRLIGHDLATDVPAAGYEYVDSLDAVTKLDGSKNRLIALFDDPDFDFNQAVDQAVSRLSQNPKGYLLVAFTDCHLGKAAKSLNRVLELDKAVRAETEKHKADTLILVTADHSYDLRIKGESLAETQTAAKPQQVLSIISLEDQHTAEEVPVLADGPGSESVQGFMANTGIFNLLMNHLGFAPYTLDTKFPIAGTEGWDYISLDPASRHLYVSHGTEVEVINADSGKTVGSISNTPGVHGIAIVHRENRGFTSNGKEDTVSMFDTETLKLLSKIPVGKGPDGIYYDAKSNRVFTNNHGSHDITAIDAASGKVIGAVAIEGDGEQAVSSGTGLIYVNLEDKSEVAAFDPITLEVKKRYPIEGGHTPTGLAMDQQQKLLFVACRSQVIVVMDADTGKPIARLPIGTGVDAAAFDPESRRIFASNADGTLDVFEEKARDQYEVLGPVRTHPSAKTMVFDPKTKAIYLPGADVDTIPSTDPTKKPQRRVNAGTFGVYVLVPKKA